MEFEYTVYPHEISGISDIPKIKFEILQPPKNIPILYLDLIKKKP